MTDDLVTEAGRLLLKTDTGCYLGDMGWLNSYLSRRAEGANAEPLPWMTYPAIEFLKRRIKPSMRVFEYGAGSSTAWWLKGGCAVVSCEHDEAWGRETQERCPEAKVVMRVLDDGSYASEITRYTAEFDIIVIDGRQRVACTRNALGALAKGGVLIFDNSDRADYEEAYQWLQQHCYRSVDFWGMGPVNLYAWCTSIYYRDNNCMGL